MSDVAQGPGWWQASDGRWYPPETLAQAMVQSQPAVPGAPGGVGAVPDQGPGQPQTQPQVQPQPLAGYGPASAPELPGYTWPGYPAYSAYPTYPAYPAYPSGNRNRTIGTLLVLLGVSGLVWGVGGIFNALAFNSIPAYPHDQQIAAWILAAGILLVSLVTIAIGLVHRRP